MGIRYSNQEWIAKVNIIHNNFYNYDKTIFKAAKDKVIITCPLHGDFEQKANHHMSGHGCKLCSSMHVGDIKRKSSDAFIEEANKIHENYYNYSEINYLGVKVKIKIICPKHGDFWQTPDSHINGKSGCPLCWEDKRKEILRKENIVFIQEATILHDGLYDYSKVNYLGSKEKICIICKEHGEFWQTSGSHLSGSGCPKCGIIKTKLSRLTLKEVFVERANIVHNFKYDYTLVDYTNLHDKIKIKCLIHGEFLQTGSSHLQGVGCPICNYSKGELLIYDWLKENNIPFKTQFELITPEIARNSNVMLVDFFVKHKGKQYFIEYDGEQHFKYKRHFHKTEEGFEKEQRRDKVLNEFCELHKDKVTLIRFKYDQSREEVINLLKEYFNN